MLNYQRVTRSIPPAEGFYDLLNLRFQRLPGSGRVRFAATVAAGSYSVLAPVDPRFMLVVCIKVPLHRWWGIYLAW